MKYRIKSYIYVETIILKFCLAPLHLYILNPNQVKSGLISLKWRENIQIVLQAI